MRRTPPPDFDSASFDRFYWHQGWDVFPGVRTPGRSPVEEMFSIAGIPSDLSGQRIIEIGAWHGCASLECERRGAKEVVALSLEDPALTGFDFLRDLTGAERTRFVRGTIYDLDPIVLGTFDTVICFGVIYHLRYPVLGLDNLRRIASGTLFLETHLLDDAFYIGGDEQKMSLIDSRLEDASLVQFYKGNELQGSASNWFSPSMSALVGILETAGFKIERTHKHASRGYVTGTVRPGLPPFIDGREIYESDFYDLNFARLFGPREAWRR